MPNTHSTLTALFTDIASAIREKDGTSTAKVADAFPSAIRAIPSGGGSGNEDAIIEGTISGVYSNSTVSVIQRYRFNNTRLTEVSFENCTSIMASSFTDCKSLTKAAFPNCQYLENDVFIGCTSLVEVSLPKCSIIYASAFSGCSSLPSMYLPSCIDIKNGVFKGCTNLKNVNLPECTTIGSSVFYDCQKLSSVSLPKCNNVGANVFRNCQSLSEIVLPSCSRIAENAFQYCTKLSTVSLPVCKNISVSAFKEARMLLSLYLLSPSVCTLQNSNVFLSTPIAGSTSYTSGVYGSIFVPMSLLSSYKSATNWTYFSSRFVGV